MPTLDELRARFAPKPEPESEVTPVALPNVKSIDATNVKIKIGEYSYDYGDDIAKLQAFVRQAYRK